MTYPEASAANDPIGASVPRARVLVVDDDSRNLLALREVLEDIAEIVCVSSGQDALRRLLKEQFAVILLDVLMPGIDGYETAKLVRMREQSRDTPIIFLTAINKEDTHLLRGYDSGAVDYVFKPFEPVILRSKVSVFVSLYEKTKEVERKAAREQQLLQESLRVHTEKLKADQALREAEERQALILKALPLAVFLAEKSSAAPHFVGGDVAGLTGFKAEDFHSDGDLWLSRLHPDDRTVALRTASVPDAVQEYRWLHADGEYRTFLDHRVPVSGRPQMIAGTLRDVTDQRRLEDQLLQSQKLDAIGKLTGGIAHDFNNLLASVLSGIALLERRVMKDQRSEQVLGMMRHAAQQGSQLVKRLLAFSRRQNLQPEVVDLKQAGRTLDDMLSPVLGGMVALNWDFERPLWPAYVDPSQLELAIINLVLNARDAMPEGGSIHVRAENILLEQAKADLPAGEYVVVSVSDTGTGIAPELLSKVLEPFFTTKSAGKGTGLGLSTALGFARQSGGTLRLLSELGKGTTAELWLPRSPVDQAVSKLEWTAASGVGDLSRGASATVLLVDDSASLRNLTEMQLAEAGFKVVCAGGGAEAIALINEAPTRFDVILTDYAMPLMSGLDVVRHARTIRADWPSVIITGYADEQDIARRPADVPLISKPFSPRTLLDALRQVMSVEAR